MQGKQSPCGKQVELFSPVECRGLAEPGQGRAAEKPVAVTVAEFQALKNATVYTSDKY